MNSEQNKIINITTDSNNNNLEENKFLIQIKDKIHSFENKNKHDNNINNEINQQNEKDNFKTENDIKIIKDDFISKKEELKDNKLNNLIDNNSNINVKEDIKTSKEISLNEDNKTINKINKENKNEVVSNEREIINNDIQKEKLKEENETTKNIINEENINKIDNQKNGNKNNNKNDFSENGDNQNKPNKSDKNEINTEKSEEKNCLIENNVEEKKDIINIETENKDSKIKTEVNHNINPSCLNKCIQWTLNTEVKSKNNNQQNDDKSQYLLDGTSIYFKKLDQSLLNSLHNPQNIPSGFYRTMLYQGIIDSIKEESNKKLNTSNQNSYEQLFNLNYPLDNTKSNYSIIDSNLSFKENLKNIFLIEINLDQINQENNNTQENQFFFRKINDNCVEKELDFKLNGFFHGKKMFQKDLTFSVEYRDFIKSIQFQIKSRLQKNKNLSQNFQNIFFAKVLNNANLGIEFFVPSLNDNSQTNFNAIVNSHIEINKIFLELTIPNNYFNNNINSNNNDILNEDSNSISTKRTEITSPKKEENNISNSNSNHNSNKNLNFNMNTKNNNIPNRNNNFTNNYLFNSPNFQTFAVNKNIIASPHLNNYQKYIYQQKYSPLINSNFHNNNINFNLVNNNFQPIPNQNRFYPTTPNYPLSPVPPPPQQIFCSPQPNTFSPLSPSLIMMKIPHSGQIMQQQPLSMNSPFNTNTSNFSCSPYLGPNQNNTNTNKNTPSINSSNNRKNSESFQNENQLNNFQRKVYNSNHQTPLMMRTKEEEYLNQFMSPKSVGSSTNFNLMNNFNLANLNLNVNMNRINGSGYQLNPMNNINQMKQQMNQMGNINQINNVIPMTIRQKIFEKTKNEEVDRINKILNTMNRIRPNTNNNINNMNNININNINNFNNSASNNNIRANIIKNNIMNNMNMSNPNNININPIKNIPNIVSIPNNQNIPNIININNNIVMNNNINVNNNNNFNNLNRANNNINNKMNVNNNEKGDKKEETKTKNVFIMENQNKTNLDIFLKSITPYCKIQSNTELSKLKIKNIFDSMKLISLLGLKNIYFNNDELINIWYSLTLSSFFIKVKNKQLISKIFDEIKIRKKYEANLILKQNEEIKILDSQFALYFTTEYLDISFIESKPEYNRKSFNTLIKLLINSIPFFEQISSEDIDLNKSYFAILFSSVKILKPFTPHSFLVYYNFNNDLVQENKKGMSQNNSQKLSKLRVVGILPFKVNTEFFMQKINFNNNMLFKQPLQNYGFYNPDNFPLINVTYKAINDIQKYTKGNSYDYEHFLKMKNYNYKQ